jgi:hypothetical protein
MFIKHFYLKVLVLSACILLSGCVYRMKAAKDFPADKLALVKVADSLLWIDKLDGKTLPYFSGAHFSFGYVIELEPGRHTLSATYKGVGVRTPPGFFTFQAQAGHKYKITPMIKREAIDRQVFRQISIEDLTEDKSETLDRQGL